MVPSVTVKFRAKRTTTRSSPATANGSRRSKALCTHPITQGETVAFFTLSTQQSGATRLTLVVTIALLGFPLSPTQGKCQCDSHYDVECNINSHSFFRSANSRTWIGFINEFSNASSKPGVMYHPNCPIGYCSCRNLNITSGH